MLFQRINRSNPEKIFLVVYNSSATAMTNGQAVNWDFITDRDGIGVVRPLARATNAGVALAGIVAENIAVSGYGLIQVYGYHSAVRTRSVTSGVQGTWQQIAKGTPLYANAAGSLYCLESHSTSADAILAFPCAFALAANTKWTTVAIACFIKAL